MNEFPTKRITDRQGDMIMEGFPYLTRRKELQRNGGGSCLQFCSELYHTPFHETFKIF